MVDWEFTDIAYLYHYDGLGSVRALSDYTQEIKETYDYTVFGEPNTTSTVGNPYMFTGRRYDPNTGLYNYRARWYQPEIGRFMQTDPIGYTDNLNLYLFGENNPILNKDPLGLVTAAECEDQFRKRKSDVLDYVHDCVTDYCSLGSPIGWEVGGSVVACAKSGPFFGLCFTICTGGLGAANGTCGIMCAMHGRQMYNSAKDAYESCMDRVCE